MSDDTKQTGSEDRDRVAADQPHEVSYLAGKYDLTLKQVRDTIREHGPMRARVEIALGKLRTRHSN